MAAQLDTLTCNGCGANLAYAAGIPALECEYCKATTPTPHAAHEREDSAALLIPFALDQDAIGKAVLQHLASGRYTKDDLVACAVVTKSARFYAPAWSFSGSYSAHWTASFGFDRSESYVDTVRRTENGQTRREPVTRTRTVTNWTPVSGADSGSFALLGYGGSGLPPAAIELIEHSGGLGQLTAFTPAHVRGIETQPFAQSQHDTYVERIDARVQALIDAGIKRHAQGSAQRDWHWSSDVNKKVAMVHVPVCQVQYEYKGKTYQLWIDGANPAHVTGDSLPTSFGRRIRLFMGYFVPFWATMALLTWTPFLDNWLPARMAAVAVLWGHAAWRRHRIFQHSLHIRQLRLAARNFVHGAPAAIKSGIDWLAAAGTIASIAIFVVLLRHMPDPKAVQVPAEPVMTAPAPVPAVAPIAVPGAFAADQAVQDSRARFAALLVAANAEDWTQVRSLSAELKQAAPAQRGDRAQSKTAHARGVAALRRDDHAAAITAFEAAVRADPANLDARSNLGSALIASGQFADAITVLGELLQAAPEHSKGWRQMAEAAALDGKSMDADASLRLLLHYAKDRKATIAALRKRGAAATLDKFGEAVSRVLMLSS